MFLKRITPLALLLVVNGCGSREPAPFPAAPPATVRTFVFACEEDLRFVARVDSLHAWIFLPDTTLALEHVPAASGARFTDGTSIFWSRGEEARLETGGRTYDACRNLPAEAAWEHAKLNGFDFRALGNEPGWILELGPREVVLVTDYGERTLRFPPADPVEDPGTHSVRYDLAAGEHTLTVTLSPGPCFDDMSGREFQTVVHLDLDGRVYRGCGNPLH